MSELTPERRQNKNGVTVTRWVRKDEGNAPKGRSIPKIGESPKAKLEARRSRTLNKMVKLLVLHGHDYTAADARMFFNETVGKYTSMSSFDVIDAALKKDPQSILDVELITSDYPEPVARNLIHFSEYMRDDVTGEDCHAAIAGLKAYKHLSGVDDLSALKGQAHEEVVALLRTGLHIIAVDPDYRAGIRNSDAVKEARVGEFQPGRISEYQWHITDQKLVDVVLTNVDRVDDILELMSERKVFDGELIAGFLGEHSALNKGVL